MSTVTFKRLTASIQFMSGRLFSRASGVGEKKSDDSITQQKVCHQRQKTNDPVLRSLKISLVSFALGCVPGIAAQPAIAQAQSAKICQSQLEPAIAAIANRPELRRSRWGILVETLTPGNNQTLYNQESDRYFIPASNAKLLTSAAALHHLGPDFRIRTSIYGPNTSETGNINPLRIVGRGDPSITKTQLEAIAEQLQQQGIRNIGQLIAEDTYFQGSSVNPNWEWEDVQAGYGAPINSLIFNQNAIELKLWPQTVGQPLRVTWADPQEAQQWRIENKSTTVASDKPEFIDVGRDFSTPVIRVSGQLRAGAEPEDVYVAVVDPGANFLRHFRQALTAKGITAGSGIVTTENSDRPGERELAFIESPPLSELVMEVNQKSNNLYTEVLLRSLGANAGLKIKTPQPENTAEAGLQVLKATLTELGVDPDTYQLGDGSGLSRQSLVSPQALVQTLRAMAFSPHAQLYRSSLPIAGASGTLRGRFRETSAANAVQAKTGTLTGVSALSGYVANPEYETLVFSIIVNQSDRSSSSLRQAIDEIVLLLTQVRRC